MKHLLLILAAWFYGVLFFLGLVLMPAVGFLIGWATARQLAFARANWRALATFALLSWLVWLVGFWVGLNSDWLLTFIFVAGAILGFSFMWKGGLRIWHSSSAPSAGRR